MTEGIRRTLASAFRRAALPLGAYYGVTLVLPLINGAAEFPEGPFWAEGKLYYAEYGGNRVSVWDGTANRVFWTQGVVARPRSCRSRAAGS